jgi:hypothetical protein
LQQATEYSAIPFSLLQARCDLWYSIFGENIHGIKEAPFPNLLWGGKENVKVYAGIRQRALRKGSQLVLTLARAPPKNWKKRNNRD